MPHVSRKPIIRYLIIYNEENLGETKHYQVRTVSGGLQQNCAVDIANSKIVDLFLCKTP